MTTQIMNTATLTDLQTLVSSLIPYNTFKVTTTNNTLSNTIHPNPFMCNSIECVSIPKYNAQWLTCKRHFLSPVNIEQPLESVTVENTGEYSAIYTLHMRGDDRYKEDTIIIEASYDETVFVPTKPCEITSDNFTDTSWMEFLANPEFFDPHRSKPNEGLFIVDLNRLGVMTEQQEFMIGLKIEMEVEYPCCHNLKTVGFEYDGTDIWIGVWNLEDNKFQNWVLIGDSALVERLRKVLK